MTVPADVIDPATDEAADSVAFARIGDECAQSWSAIEVQDLAGLKNV